MGASQPASSPWAWAAAWLGSGGGAVPLSSCCYSSSSMAASSWMRPLLALSTLAGRGVARWPHAPGSSCIVAGVAQLARACGACEWRVAQWWLVVHDAVHLAGLGWWRVWALRGCCVMGHKGRLVHGVQRLVVHHLDEPALLSDLELETNAAPRLLGLDGWAVAEAHGAILIGVQGGGSGQQGGGQGGGRLCPGHRQRSTSPAMPYHKLGEQV